MEAEYYPPREVVILQNEAPRDVYILVSGAVVSATIFWNTDDFAVHTTMDTSITVVILFGRKSG